MLNRMAFGFYKVLLVLAGVAMIAAFVSIMLNIMARIFLWNIPGLDGYAGYAIAAALFLALPSTLQSNEHIRATLLLDHVSPGARGVMETVALFARHGHLHLSRLVCHSAGVGVLHAARRGVHR